MTQPDLVAARELAERLAPMLPAGWAVAPAPPVEHSDWADLVRGDGATIRIRVGGWRREGRVTFHGVWPRYRDGSGYQSGRRVDITCDARRSPEAIAKDLRRRFLPAYDAAYAAALAFVRQDDEHGEEADAVAARLALVAGGHLGDPKARRGDERRIYGTPEAVCRLAVRPAYTSSSDMHTQPVRVDFEVHGLDPETAARVLEVIRAAEEQQADASGVRIAPPAEEDLDERAEEEARPRARLAGGGP